MKKFSLVSLFLLLSSIVISYSCSNELEDVGSTSAEGRMVTITTRSSSGETTSDVPITIFVFKTGRNTVYKKVTNSIGNFEFSLPKGSYNLVAIVGNEELYSQDNPTIESRIGVPDNGIMDEPLQMGRAVFEVTNSDVEVTINMIYPVSKVNISLLGIPEDVEEVEVMFSQLYEDILFNGEGFGTKDVKFILLHDKTNTGTWAINDLYVLPSAVSQLPLTVTFKKDGVDKIIGDVSLTKLEPKVPYNFVGSYSGDFEINGVITEAGWNESKTIEFSFGPGAEEDNTGSGDTGGPDDNGGAGNEGEGGDNVNSDGIYMVDEIPSERTIWDGHFVVSKKKNDDDTHSLFLMSIKEYRILKSDAENKRASYEENGISEWLIPTTDELKDILASVVNSGAVNATNSTLATIQGDNMSADNYYLCDGGDRFLWATMTNSNTANQSDTYSLRLVKTVKVKLQSTEGQ